MFVVSVWSLVNPSNSFQAHYHASVAELIEQSGLSSPRGGRPSSVVSKEKLSWAAYHYAQAGILLPDDEQLRIDCLRNALIHAIKVCLYGHCYSI